MSNTNDGKVKFGSLEKVVVATFDNVMRLSNLGLKGDMTFVKQLSMAFKALANLTDETLVNEVTSFMHPIIGFEDFETGRSYKVCLDGITDEMVVAEIISSNIGAGRTNGFAIGCFVDCASDNNTCIVTWPNDDHIVKNKTMLALLSTVGLIKSGSVSRKRVSDYSLADIVSAYIVKSINDRTYIPKGISLSDIKTGLKNIIDLNLVSENLYTLSSLQLILGLVDVKGKIIYDIVCNDDGEILTIYSTSLFTKDNLYDTNNDIYIVFVNEYGAIDMHGVRISDIYNGDKEINFIDIVKSLAETIID